VLRYANHLDFANPYMRETDTTRYHGGSPPDELAALMSLALGVRAKRGGQSRIFDGSDPLGRPVAWAGQADPVILRGGKHQFILPSAVGSHSLEDLAPLRTLPLLSAAEAVALIRAARLYQDGLWIAESEPALAWIMLVSAIEAVALKWSQRIDTPVERLKYAKPDLVKLLEAKCESILPDVAKMLADSFGSTRKFVDFLIEFFPRRPSRRPRAVYQRRWNKEEFRKDLKTIYNHRSKALHRGTPFPAPMCGAPFREGRRSRPSERLVAEGWAANEGVWQKKDVPMQLHLFEYIVRGALLRWWLSRPETPLTPVP
jgi:hypothetical protein